VVKSIDTYQKCGQPLDFTSEECEFMADLIEADPTLYLDEICDSMRVFQVGIRKTNALNFSHIVYTLNESAIVQWELYQNYGQAFKGHYTKQQQQTWEGVQYSLLPAINLDGLLAVACQEGSYLHEDFEDYLEFNLVCSSFE
ncbi:hypothetical protein CROQUDRAFT_651214, partial [Cronartium quercuum f. sp. fusiforme G11]